MTHIHPLPTGRRDTRSPAGPDVLGSKGHGLTVLVDLGLPVPPGFVISAQACREFLRDGRLPQGLDADLATAVGAVEAATGRRFGGPGHPLLLSVRSGAAVSMPGMMNTFLNVGLTASAATALAAETGSPSFADDLRRRAASGVPALAGEPFAQLRTAVAAVFSSWHTPRAVSYRELHDIPHDLGTAVVVQAMVFGNRDEHSGSGVAFSRDPGTGVRTPYGDVLFGHQGEDVVSGRCATRPLADLAAREPAVWEALLDGLDRVERHYRDVCHVEFTFEAGRLWFLQVRPGGLSGRAAVRVAVDLVDEQLIDRPTALSRITPHHLRAAGTPRIRTAPAGRGTPAPASGRPVVGGGDVSTTGVVRSNGGRPEDTGIADLALDGESAGSGDPAGTSANAGSDDTTGKAENAAGSEADGGGIVARGVGASPGVAAGRIAVTADRAVRMAADGPVILVRPHTSPLDMHGLAAAAGVVTTVGGPASHAAVVARAMGRPAVVAAAALVVDQAAGHVVAAGRVLPEGTVITIDGTGGEVVVGTAEIVTADADPHLTRLLGWIAES